MSKLSQQQKNDIRQRIENTKQYKRELVAGLLENANFLDEDGYPTDDALTIVENWDDQDPRGWFAFIEKIWAMKYFGWNTQREPHELIKDVEVDRWYLSTAGWSGNESIIRAMQQNEMMWYFHWVESRRGGHYIFEVDLRDD